MAFFDLGLSGLLGAGSSLIGNLIGSSNVDKNNETQLKIAAQNIALQKEFAQHGISWKVEDAKAAGLHPLAALGAQTSSFSPVSVGTEAFKPDLSELGQNLERAFKASQSQEDREKADVAKARKLQLEKGALQNDLLKQELVSNVRKDVAQLGPGMPWGSIMGHLDRGRQFERTPEGVAVQDEPIKQASSDLPAIKRAGHYGVPWEHNPNFSDAQKYEDRYGDFELGSALKWVINHGADIFWNYGRSDPTTLDDRRRWMRERGGR